MKTPPLLSFRLLKTTSNPLASPSFSIRPFTTSTPYLSNNSPSPPVSSPRWLSETKSRIGKCITFGLSLSQTQKASEILSILGTSWRSLIAGREGFLTSPNRAGLLRQRVVWGEMDSMGHVNNVTYTRYAESARIEWARNYALEATGKDGGDKEKWNELWTPKGEGLILRSIRTDYKFPMTWPDHISVFHKLRSLPSTDSTSFILDVMILSELHQRPAARCVEDIVVYDYRISRPITVRLFMMEAFKKIWREQEEARRISESRIQEIEGGVRELETGSWDQEDAVEDVGGTL